MESKFVLLQTKYGSVLKEMSLQGDRYSYPLLQCTHICLPHLHSSIGGYDDSKHKAIDPASRITCSGRAHTVS